MKTIQKIEEVLHQFALEGKPSKHVHVYLTSRDYDDFQEDTIERINFISRVSSGDKNLTTGELTFFIMGFIIHIHRTIYRPGLMVYELGYDRELYSRSIVVYERGLQKDIILL